MTSRRVASIKQRVAAVAAANRHTVAVLEGGHVYSWGCNLQGQLGYGTSDSASNAVPRIVEAMKVSLASVIFELSSLCLGCSCTSAPPAMQSPASESVIFNILSSCLVESVPSLILLGVCPMLCLALWNPWELALRQTDVCRQPRPVVGSPGSYYPAMLSRLTAGSGWQVL